MGFQYELRKDDRVAIHRRGNTDILTGGATADFRDRLRAAARHGDAREMAQGAGQCKGGNERPAEHCTQTPAPPRP